MIWNPNIYKHHALKSAFLKTMDNNVGNDWRANADIMRLSSTMTDAQINAAYGAAHSHATKQNSKKNGLFDRKDPYKNVNSLSSKLSHMGALRSNDWMRMMPRFPRIPPMLWNFLGNCGCGMHRY